MSDDPTNILARTQQLGSNRRQQDDSFPVVSALPSGDVMAMP